MHPLWIFGSCILEVETTTQIRVWNFKFEMKTRNRNEHKKTKREKRELTWTDLGRITFLNRPTTEIPSRPILFFFSLFRASPLGPMPRLASLGGGTKRPAAACLTARWARSGQIHLPRTESRVPRRASSASLESVLALITDHRDRWRLKQIRPRSQLIVLS